MLFKNIDSTIKCVQPAINTLIVSKKNTPYTVIFLN